MVFLMDSKSMDVPVDYQALPSPDCSEMDRNGLILRKHSKISFSNGTTPLEENRIDLQWKGITYKTENGVTILNGLYGSSKSGELTAIMGPSGSGKTSLVNILSGFVQKRVTGQVLVNGAKREMNSFRKLTCYILQDDHVLPRFTVRELITFASKLKIPSTVSEEERQKAVHDCICSLGLVGQQHQRANTLSGGQRKRLCIAQEIVNNPPLIFLDEPTSGLDSSSCLQCIQLLKTLAEQGKNVICTIHQPSSRIYEIFDNLYMISDGDCIYRGPTKDLLSYLAKQGLKCPKYHSPTDFLTDIAIGLYGAWVDKLKGAIKDVDSANDSWYDKTDEDVVIKNGKRSNITTVLGSIRNRIKEILQESWKDMKNNEYSSSNFNQFRVLVKRSFLNQFRDPIHMKLKFFGSIVIGFLLGSMYYNTGNDGSKVFNTAGLLFTLMVFLVITGKIPTVLTFPLQRTIFEREHRNGWYSTKMYYLATTAAEMPYQIVCPIFTCGLLYWLSGQPHELHRVCFFILSGILIALISESIGLMIGAVTNVQNGIFISALTTIYCILLTGFFLPLTSAPVHIRWLSHTIYTKYGFSSLLLAAYNYRQQLPCQVAPCTFRKPKFILKYFGIEDDLYRNYWIMLLFFFYFRIISYLFLQFRSSRSR